MTNTELTWAFLDWWQQRTYLRLDEAIKTYIREQGFAQPGKVYKCLLRGAYRCAMGRLDRNDQQENQP